MSTTPKFKYFADPFKWSYVAEPEVPCSTCGTPGPCLDAEGFSGTQEIQAICTQCLFDGKLIPLGITTNEAEAGGSDEESKIIGSFTPKLPTWQDIWWPCVDGQYGRFLKIACRGDFSGPDELFSAVREKDRFDHNASDLWDMLEDGPIECMKDAQSDISFYLFEVAGHKLVLWDAS